MPSELGDLLQGRVLPNHDLILRVSMGGDQLATVFRPRHIAHLTARVDVVNELARERVPESHATIRRAPCNDINQRAIIPGKEEMHRRRRAGRGDAVTRRGPSPRRDAPCRSDKARSCADSTLTVDCRCHPRQGIDDPATISIHTPGQDTVMI